MRHAIAAVLLGATLSCRAGPTPAAASSAASPAPAAAPGGTLPDSVAAIRAANALVVDSVLRAIAGQESKPAAEVFEDVRWLKDVNARTFLTIMSIGYANALGVRCAYCHDVSNFASEEKRPKRAAREMQVMHRSINTQLMAMQNLATQPPDRRAINCTLCHQGRINPNKRP
ncbi:MAG: photosynthetic reaction center cytochrome c subunit [Gemmatimonadetes bacterium]|nr:photosynthetic reaction center cytochrome c subunit [Gemmatimonadota bacterium]